MTTYRPAYADERARATSLCEPSAALPGDGETQCFVAVKSRPVERIVGAAFWRERPSSGSVETCVSFEWAVVAAMQGSSAESEFLNSLADGIHSSSAELRTTAWLEPHSPAAEILSAAGFLEVALRETFTAKAPAWRKILDSFPAQDLQASPLTREHAADVRRLLAGCAYSDNELNHGFDTATQENPSLFDFPSSAILIRDGRICGVCLALTNPNRTHLDITALAIDGEEIALEAEVAALLRQILAGSTLKELSIQRLSILGSALPSPQPALDHLLANYPSTPLTKESRHGKSFECSRRTKTLDCYSLL
jgi:hypothetical protein